MAAVADLRRVAPDASVPVCIRAKKRTWHERWYFKVDWARLIAAVAERQDREAFERLFVFFAPRVKSMAIRTGASNELAEEIAQETLLMVWRKAAQFDPSSNGAAAWIFTIARNLRVDEFRRTRIAGSMDGRDPDLQIDQAATPDAVLQSRQDFVRVQRALATLSDEQIRAIKDSYYEDKSHGEIAAESKLPLGTVKSRLRLAIQHLRVILDDDK